MLPCTLHKQHPIMTTWIQSCVDETSRQINHMPSAAWVAKDLVELISLCRVPRVSSHLRIGSGVGACTSTTAQGGRSQVCVWVLGSLSGERKPWRR
jgi:hypothetical protein